MGAEAMFGYVKAYKPEMKIKHYEEYRGVYCSVCRTLRRRYGVISALTLSYDYTFFAMMRLCTREVPICFEQKRCPFNPAKKCNFCNSENEDLNYTADIAMIMVYYKILDNISDGGFFKKILMYLILPIFTLYYKKARKNCPEADRIVGDMMKKQAETEKIKTADIDLAADPTAEAMSALLSLGFSVECERVLKRIGYLIGRWVYIVDALDDMEEDRKCGGYNPILLSGKTADDIEQTLNMTAAEITAAYDLLDVKSFGSVIYNIVYDGLYMSMKSVKNGGKTDERSL